MKTRLSRIFFASLFAFCPVAGRGFEFSEHTVSPSGQFIVYGADDATRGALSEVAERIKANFLSVLKRRDAWRIAVVVNLQSRAVNLPEVPATDLRFSQTETGAKLQLNLAVSAKTDPLTIERALARVIVIEMIYRSQTGVVAGDVYVEPPGWLVNGLLASAPNKDRTELVGVLSTPAREISLTEFLNQRLETLDSSTRQIYRAYSFVLVQMLMDSPNGRSRLGHYIDNLAFATNDPIADLRAAFPELGDFGRAWKTKIADLKTGADKDLLSFSQTDEKLNELLQTNFPSRDGGQESVSLESFSHAKPNPTQRRTLQEFSQQLLLLATRANPILRPIVQDYQRAADEVVLGRKRGIEKRLAELRSLHTRLAARMNDVEDYLNWFEAAKLETPSGIFDNYLQATTSIEVQKPRRKDALSVYLDAMEMEF
ncbi:MAG TPA: hypothetical protein VKS98_00740 [Chthoniobacterales bacterium]|nr:hypothetical protein [Chthoniobacterales bacterium]